MPGLARSLLTAIARLPGDNGGASAAIVVLALPCLIGFGALGAEAGAWFTLKLRNQAAADAAAISAAYEVIAGNIDAIIGLIPAATEAAVGNGYTGTNPAVSYPYNDAVVGDGVAVSLQQTRGTLLAAMFLSSVTVANKAVAVSEVLDNPCLLALGTPGTDVELAASVSLSMPDCSIVANSIGSAAIALGSGSSITAAAVVTSGEISVDGNSIDPGAPPSELILGTTAMIGAPPVSDPYASTLTHTYLTAGMPTLIRCRRSGSGGGAVVYSSNCFIPGTSLEKQSSITLTGNTQISGGWTITTGHTVTLSPGTYWITAGALTIQSGGVLKGDGVTIILTTATNTIGALSMAPGSVLNLNAPGFGPFAGMVLIQDANDLPSGTAYASGFSSITGATLNGLVYFPNSSLMFDGNPSANGPRCLLLVASSVRIAANSSLESEGCAQAGLVNLPTVLTVALAE